MTAGVYIHVWEKLICICIHICVCMYACMYVYNHSIHINIRVPSRTHSFALISPFSSTSPFPPPPPSLLLLPPTPLFSSLHSSHPYSSITHQRISPPCHERRMSGAEDLAPRPPCLHPLNRLPLRYCRAWKPFRAFGLRQL